MDQLYLPLDPDSIRLLGLHDDTGLSCSLATFRLQKAPPFVAFSYTWGEAVYQTGRSSDQEYAITVNGHQVLIQQNLYDAVTTLANDVRGWGGRNHLFWVDFVCINQSDVKERSIQVRLMKDIYERSAAVIAWLGLPYDDEETRLAVDLMQSFDEDLRTRLESHNGDIDAVLVEIDALSPGFPSTKDSHEWKAWTGIAEMMERDYWSRTWIHQEATTPGEIWFYCGRECFDDTHLNATSAFATEFSTKCPEFDSRFSTSVGLGSNMSLLASARIERDKGQKRSLCNLVEEVRTTSCSNDRDKVYAPLGHAVDIQPGQMVVDYTKDVVTVFGDLVRHELVNDPSAGLIILENVHFPAPDAISEFLSEVIDPLWPSWIPDWRQRVSLVPFYSDGEDQSTLADPCPGSEVLVEFSGNMMSIKGFTLKHMSLTYVTPICENDQDIIGVVKSWYSEMTAGNVSTKIDESILRSLVADVGGFKSDAEGRRYRTRGYAVDWSIIHAGDEMSGRVSAVCLGRRMGKTQDGHVGIFPAAATMDDIVAIFHGGHILYLLRPVSGVEGHFQFIGPCYVDGLMDGEAVQDNPYPRMLHLV